MALARLAAELAGSGRRYGLNASADSPYDAQGRRPHPATATATSSTTAPRGALAGGDGVFYLLHWRHGTYPRGDVRDRGREQGHGRRRRSDAAQAEARRATRQIVLLAWDATAGAGAARRARSWPALRATGQTWHDRWYTGRPLAARGGDLDRPYGRQATRPVRRGPHVCNQSRHPDRPPVPVHRSRQPARVIRIHLVQRRHRTGDVLRVPVRDDGQLGLRKQSVTSRPTPVTKISAAADDAVERRERAEEPSHLPHGPVRRETVSGGGPSVHGCVPR